MAERSPRHAHQPGAPLESCSLSPRYLYLLSCLRPPLQLLFPVHASPAILRPAPAHRWIVVVSVVQVVVVGQFFPGHNVAQSDDPDMFVELVGFTVGIAAMVDESCDRVAIDHAVAFADAEQVGIGAVAVELVGLLLGDPRPGVLDNVRALGDVDQGIAAAAVDPRAADQQVCFLDAPDSLHLCWHRRHDQTRRGLTMVCQTCRWRCLRRPGDSCGCYWKTRECSRPTRAGTDV